MKYLLIALVFTLTQCTPSKSTEEAEAAKPSVNTTPAVATQAAQRKAFQWLLLSNGRVSNQSASKIGFKTNGVIAQINVQNGSVVRAGQVLAQLENREQLLALRQAELQLAEARVEINDLLISQGGRKGDTTSVKADVWAYIKLRSGYERGLLALQKARNDVDNTYLRAPFGGVVANLNAKPFSAASVEFCTLLSQAAPLVEFAVLETELMAVQLGQSVAVQPVAFGERRYKGQVVEINPYVSEQGLVLVKARINGADKYLFEGMNVRVQVEKNIPNQIVVPKAAVVERSGRKVVFIYAAETDTSGLAKWNYVTVAHENDTETALSEGIKAGDAVIVEGNLNLGHDARVKLKKKENPD
ncbi:efflux RND transporter periplasmic adaptor subunit [Runella slithyformis]|uniref:Efflux transporter, RND family, MFP subunit n=1 Tax=Runella slithyformis (strain ATCC 29530 / DSM 19594 / LMG 11500 / NCIMB 11436 / LSU 4) TaxID=761193 RepID=A0A7U4E6J7_RUNSL|nr:efflux RND transporter periplasmic adaptor subunit [Runella slithyformis]AEI49638.1 efflux transporter, RND family, MFP subunit [Runella slithyformis DSM 19594]